MTAGDIELAQVAQAGVAGVEGWEVGNLGTAGLSVGEELGQPGPLPHHVATIVLAVICLLTLSLSPGSLSTSPKQPKQHANMVCRPAESQNQGGVLSHQTMVLLTLNISCQLGIFILNKNDQ